MSCKPVSSRLSMAESEKQMGERETNLSYDHEVSWDQWALEDHGHEATVVLDGKVIGVGNEAIRTLTKQSWPAGTRVKVNLLPKPLNTEDLSYPFYSHTQFFQNWVKAGVELSFFMNGKKQNVHTLLFEELVPDAHTQHYNWDKAIWYFDSEKFSNGKAAVEAMKRVKWGNESTILYLFPDGWNTREGIYEKSEMDEYKAKLYEAGVQRVHVGDGPWHFMVAP